MDVVVHCDAVRHPHRPHEYRSDAARPALAGSRGRRRHAHRRADHAPRDQPDLPAVAQSDALDRTAPVALAARASRRSPRLDRSRCGRLATLAAHDGPPAARAALFDSGDARSRTAARAADCRDSRRDGAGLGHELVFRHGELGGRDVELLGGIAHRHLARSDGARGARGRRRQRRARELCRQSAGRRLRRFLVRRDRRHRRRRRLAARAARPAPVGRERSRRAFCGHLVRRGLSDRRDARLRSEVLAAVQRGEKTGLRHPRESRLVRRARSLRRHVSPGRCRARQHSCARRLPICA